MQLHSKGERFLVIDNALDPDQATSLRAIYDAALLRPTLSAVNAFHDGFCFTAPGPDGPLNGSVPTEEHRLIHDLANRAADMLIKHVAVPTISEKLTYSTFYSAYPIGTKLSWHDDGANRVGAFIYYLGSWSSDWGGELDIIDCHPHDIPNHGSLAESVAAAPLNATSIFPKNNRLVVFSAPIVHRIRRIDQHAGSHVRQAISGFLSSTSEEMTP